MSKNIQTRTWLRYLAAVCILPVATTVRTLAQDAASAEKGKIPAEKAAPATEKPETEEILVLSPFEVDASKDKGYYAENTLAGSRMSSNLSDLASSISVVTKQQMEDTGSVGINDVFRYEASTEGSGTYTPVIIDRGTAKDTGAGYSYGNNGAISTNNTSNRMRGMGSPDSAINYYAANTRIPFDAYNTQSVEISRGPNSMLFGLGSPAGIVNQSTAQAVLDKNINEVTLRTDNNGSFRTSLSVNRSLIPNKLALYMALLYDNEQFVRKPSYDLTRRQYATLTYKPFKSTALRGSVEGFTNNANRPNTLTPRDWVTPWFQAGRPQYDPVTRMVTYLDTNQKVGPYTLSTYSPGNVLPTGSTFFGDSAMTTTLSATSNSVSPLFASGIIFYDSSRPLLRVENGTLIDWFQKQPSGVVSTFTNPASAAYPLFDKTQQDPAKWAMYERRWTQSTALPIPANMAVYNNPGVTDAKIYDWNKWNINQANYAKSRSGTYNLEFEQQITPELFFSAGWLRQDIDEVDNYTISELTGATLAIDTNKNLPNGQANPYFGKVYVDDFTPDTFMMPETWDSYRAMLSYSHDFTKNTNWTRWLGQHRLLGFWSDQKIKSTTIRHRLEFTSGDADATLRYLPNSTIPGYNYVGGALRRDYYLESPTDPDGTVTHSTGTWGQPGYGGPSSGQISVYNWNTGQFQNDSVGIDSPLMPNGSYVYRREIKSWNFAMQNNFLEDSIVTTFGRRSDHYRARQTTTNQINDPITGKMLAPALQNADIYDPQTGLANESLVLHRYGPWTEGNDMTSTAGVVVRPFREFGYTKRASGQGLLLGEFLNSFGLTFNKSSNFNPPSASNTDLFGRQLAVPTGTGKDYGFEFAVLDNKFVIRLNRFQNTDYDERAGNTGFSRITNVETYFQDWAAYVVRVRSGEDPSTSQNFLNGGISSYGIANIQTLTAAQQAQVAALTGLPFNYVSGLTPSATQTVKATGTELQLTYNPLPNWTMKVTGSKTEAVYTNVMPEYDEWINLRLPVWQAASAPDMLVHGTANALPTTSTGGTTTDVTKFWDGYGYDSSMKGSPTSISNGAHYYFNNNIATPVAIAKTLSGQVTPNLRKYHSSFVTNYEIPSGIFKGVSFGGAERFESKAAIGYLGMAADPALPNIINASDPSKPVYDHANYYTDLWAAYSMKMFHDKVRVKFQLNVVNVTEDGHLQAIAVNWDGSPYAYRIVDSRQFVLSAKFTF